MLFMVGHKNILIKISQTIGCHVTRCIITIINNYYYLFRKIWQTWQMLMRPLIHQEKLPPTLKARASRWTRTGYIGWSIISWNFLSHHSDCLTHFHHWLEYCLLFPTSSPIFLHHYNVFRFSRKSHNTGNYVTWSINSKLEFTTI